MSAVSQLPGREPARQRPRGARPAITRILSEDPDLLAGLAPDRAAEAEQRVLARVVALPRGAWAPSELPGQGRGHLGLLLLDGLVLRRTRLCERQSAELLGAGDLLRPWQEHDGAYASLALAVTWEVLQPARLAVLDGEFAQAIAPWPEIMSELIGRALQRSRVLAAHLTLRQHPRLDLALLLLFWRLADRWGRVEPEGLVVALDLTQEVLGELVGAQRASVCVALGRLSGEGLIVRRADGWWLLRGEAPEIFEAKVA